MQVVSKPETLEFFDDAYNNCSIRYGDLKKQLAEDIVLFTEPFRDKIRSLSEDDAYLRKVTGEGAEVARESARKTIREVREIIGFKPF
jgi:tryptophanyl-tRNA synthetase